MNLKYYLLVSLYVLPIHTMEQLEEEKLPNSQLERFVQVVATGEKKGEFDHNICALSRNCRKYLLLITQTQEGLQVVSGYIHQYGLGLKPSERCGLLQVLHVVNGTKIQEEYGKNAVKEFNKAATKIKKRRRRLEYINNQKNITSNK